MPPPRKLLPPGKLMPKATPTLSQRMGVANKVIGPTSRDPVWKGPETNPDDDPQGGVTFSLLSRFIVCRHRFHAHAIQGLKAADGFNKSIEYGSMWHACEEAHARGSDCPICNGSGMPGGVSGHGPCPGCDWPTALKQYAKKLCREYPTQQETVVYWVRICEVQFKIYLDFWSQHEDVINGTPIEAEKVFSIPYRLPSGRVVYLRGKRDRVDMINGAPCTCGADRTGPSAEAHQKGCPAGKSMHVTGPKANWLRENKTKGELDPIGLQRQLKFDLQTMLYLTGLHWENEHDENGKGLPGGTSQVEKPVYRFGAPIHGIIYNVIRRPLAGGKGSIKQRQGKGKTPPETLDEFLARLSGIIDGTASEEGEWGPADYFYRWKVPVSKQAVDHFRTTCLDPLLETMCIWYDVVVKKELLHIPDAFTLQRILHYRYPFGVYNPIDEAGFSDLDGYLETGSEVGLTRTDNLFPELET